MKQKELLAVLMASIIGAKGLEHESLESRAMTLDAAKRTAEDILHHISQPPQEDQ